MNPFAPSTAARFASGAGLLPLESGDRLTGPEFERRSAIAPDVGKAELVEGVVHMAAAVRQSQHGRPHLILSTWLGTYLAQTPGIDAGDATTIRFDQDNVLQPDLHLRLPENAGGRCVLTNDGYLQGPPELVAEISASSSSVDMHDKLHVYRRHGVQEYLVWRVLEGAVDWLVLEQGNYKLLPADDGPLLKSRVFPGLWLDPAALVAGDLLRLLAVVNEGASTSEHRDFVAGLASDRSISR